MLEIRWMWEYIIKMHLRDTGYGHVNGIELYQNRCTVLGLVIGQNLL